MLDFWGSTNPKFPAPPSGGDCPGLEFCEMEKSREEGNRSSRDAKHPGSSRIGDVGRLRAGKRRLLNEPGRLHSLRISENPRDSHPRATVCCWQECLTADQPLHRGFWGAEREIFLFHTMNLGCKVIFWGSEREFFCFTP